MKNAVRQLRQARGLEQAELARLCGVSRQAVSAIERGVADPSTALSLAIAAALRCRVEDLFWLGEPATLPVEIARPLGQGPHGPRAAVACVDGRYVAHPLPADALATQADALVKGRSARPLRPATALREGLLAVGCDPALGLLAAHLSDKLRLTWLQAGSTAALQALARGEAHLAGSHLFDIPEGLDVVVVNLARWREGLAVAKRNPRGIRGAEDLARVRIVNREPGSGARALLDRVLLSRKPRGYETILPTHAAVAQAVAMGAADAGVTTESAALALGLGFVPLSEERSDLLLPAALAESPRGAQIVDVLRSRAFRRDLGAIDGYDTSRSGLS